MRGRKPTPTHIKLVSGNPGKRPINRNEPQPKARLPRCPEHLGEVAKQEVSVVLPVVEVGMGALGVVAPEGEAARPMAYQ